MATLEGSLAQVHGHTTVIGPRRIASNLAVYGCYVGFYIAGTYVQNDNATLLAVPTIIANSARHGGTVALLDACFAAPGNEAGTPIGAKTVAVSGANITFELTGSDMTTEHAGAVLGALSEPIYLYVTYTSTVV